jgi:prepilin-type N-terminal cleavage/methylation domain-containing protein
MLRTGPGASPRQSGFTLLEMLVVVIVLGLLMVGLTQGVRTGITMWGAQQRRVGQTAELDAGARILRLLLTGISTPAASAVGGSATDNGFSGDAGQLKFVGDLPTGLGTTRRADITIVLRKGNLVLSWTPHRHEIPLGPPPRPSEAELVAHVARLDIAYWGSTAPDQPAAWQARWDGPAPPELIRIRLGFAKTDRRRWPDLVAAPVL